MSERAPAHTVSGFTNALSYKLKHIIRGPSADLCRLHDYIFSLCEPLCTLFVDSVGCGLMVYSNPLVFAILFLTLFGGYPDSIYCLTVVSVCAYLG